MSACRFKIVETNPNETTGGGGCLCSETHNPDQEGPYAVFEATDMENPMSPFPVLCVTCAQGVVNAVGDALAGGEPVIESEAYAVPEDDVHEAEVIEQIRIAQAVEGVPEAIESLPKV